MPLHGIPKDMMRSWMSRNVLTTLGGQVLRGGKRALARFAMVTTLFPRLEVSNLRREK